MSDELIVRPAEYALSVKEVKAQVEKIQELMKDLMIEGEHYGPSYPGDKKKNLLKPGADKLCFMFRFRPEFEQQTNDLGNGHREVLTKCQIYHIDSGTKIAEGVGTCSTMETKYRWRNATRVCPICGKDAIIKGKAEYGGGWVCFKKKDGCGATFEENDPAIIGQVSGKVENTDIADVYNTVVKMSKKRAYVDAVITACAASDIFTQDAEDFQTPDPKNVTPSKDQYEAIMKDLGEVMTSTYTDGAPVFSEDDKSIVRSKIKGLNRADIKSLQSVYEDYKNIRDRRIREQAEDPVSSMVGQAIQNDELDDAAEAGFHGNLDIF